MKIIKNDSIICFDVDETLVMHISKEEATKTQTAIYMKDERTSVDYYFRPNQIHINILKSNHVRGRLVIVWSAAGYEWAKMIVDLLELNQYVDFVMTKPIGYVDDNSWDSFCPRIYVNEKGK